MKRQRVHNYHTKWLIPEDVAEAARKHEDDVAQLEEIIHWQETKRADHHFKVGDVCYHIDDIHQKLNIDKILRSYPKPFNGEKQKARLEGLSVHWHEEVFEDFV